MIRTILIVVFFLSTLTLGELAWKENTINLGEWAVGTRLKVDLKQRITGAVADTVTFESKNLPKWLKLEPNGNLVGEPSPGDIGIFTNGELIATSPDGTVIKVPLQIEVNPPPRIASGLLRFIAMAWVGGVILIGLLLNGERLYAWVGDKVVQECDRMVAKLDLMFIEVSPKTALQIYSGYLIFLFVLGLFLLYPSVGGGVFFGVFFVLVLWKVPGKVIDSMHKRRIKKFVVQMVDGLSLMSNGMRSGLNVPQALQIVMDELPNPISQEFSLVLSQNKLGVSLEEALSNLSVRMPNDDIEMFTTSVNILKETGGNLAETFDSISYTIRERIKVESKIAAMVSQGVLQGIIVVIMPFALGAILYTIDPERIRPMFTTFPGWALLTVMMALQFAGGFTIWKIVQVKV